MLSFNDFSTAEGVLKESMPYDGIVTAAAASELARTVAGAKIEKVQQPEPSTIVLQLRTETGRRKLLISAGAQSARAGLTSLELENPQEAPGFCMLLRKHIQGGRVTAVRQIETERIIEISVSTVNEMGYSVNKKLTAEIMGKYSNIILIDEGSGRIIDALKRLSIDQNRARQILPGLPYVLPPSQGKLDLMKASKEDLLRIASEAGPEDIAKALADGVQGLSYAAAQAVCADHSPEKAAEALLALRDAALSGEGLSPQAYALEDGTPKDFYIMPLPQLAGLKAHSFDSVSGCLDWFFSNKPDANRVLQKADGLKRSLNGLIDKHLLKKQRLLDDIKRSDEADIYRLKGELLNANLHLVKPGAKSVKVISYYDGSELEIGLDEKLSGAKNAQQYFKKYNKLKSAKKEKLRQLEECEADIAYLQQVTGLLPGIKTHAEIDAVREELIEQGYVRPRLAKEKAKKRQKPQPRRFVTSEGLTYCVGRNNIENDYLTFKMASKTDLWFHAKDYHGSHLVLFTQGGEPGEASIREAAAAAAFYSQGSSSQNVPVDYVPVRYVKKPSGAKPGMVIFTNNRTVWTDPADPNRSV